MLFSDYLCYVGKLISKALTFVWGVRVFNIKKNVDSHQSFNKLAVAIDWSVMSLLDKNGA
jgi:hypothetical protein